MHVPSSEQLQVSAVRYLEEGKDAGAAEVLRNCSLRVWGSGGTSYSGSETLHGVHMELTGPRWVFEILSEFGNPMREAVVGALQAVLPANLYLDAFTPVAELVHVDTGTDREKQEMETPQTTDQQPVHRGWMAELAARAPAAVIGALVGALVGGLVGAWAGARWASVPDFTISVRPLDGVVYQGGSIETKVEVAARHGYGQLVRLDAKGQPPGVDIVFSPEQEEAAQGFVSTITMTSDVDVPTGEYEIEIWAHGGDGKDRSYTYVLAVTSQTAIDAAYVPFDDFDRDGSLSTLRWTSYFGGDEEPCIAEQRSGYLWITCESSGTERVQQEFLPEQASDKRVLGVAFAGGVLSNDPESWLELAVSFDTPDTRDQYDAARVYFLSLQPDTARVAECLPREGWTCRTLGEVGVEPLQIHPLQIDFDGGELYFSVDRELVLLEREHSLPNNAEWRGWYIQGSLGTEQTGLCAALQGYLDWVRVRRRT